MATRREGWLYKQGTFGWTKKYVVLQYNLLLIFDKQPTGSKFNPTHTLQLNKCTVKSQLPERKFAFQVFCPENKDPKFVSLAAESQDELREWVELLYEAGEPVASKPTALPGRWDAPGAPATATSQLKPI